MIRVGCSQACADCAAGWHNGRETQHAIADLLACSSEGDSSSETEARRDAMGFGASLPADGQRRKARAAPRLACAPPPDARVRAFRLAKQGRADFDLCHTATHASRTMLHIFFRFARFQSTNQTIIDSHPSLMIESPSSAKRHIRHTNENPRKTGKFVHANRVGELNKVPRARHLAVPCGKKERSDG